VQTQGSSSVSAGLPRGLCPAACAVHLCLHLHCTSKVLCARAVAAPRVRRHAPQSSQSQALCHPAKASAATPHAAPQQSDSWGRAVCACLPLMLLLPLAPRALRRCVRCWARTWCSCAPRW